MLKKTGFWSQLLAWAGGKLKSYSNIMTNSRELTAICDNKSY